MNLSNHTNEYSNIKLKNDKKLAQFHYIICRKKYLHLEKWILQNELVVNSSVSTNSPIFPGYTPLHFAVKCINLNAIAILLEHGADFTLKNKRGQTPLHLCMKMILFNQYQSFNPKKIHSKGDLQIILDQILSAHVTKSVIVNPVDNMGLSHFHIACYINKLDIVLRFLQCGVRINSFIKFDSPYWPGYAALHIASRYLLEDMVNLLVKYGADINAKNAAGLTPLYCVLKSSVDESTVSSLFSLLSKNCINPIHSVGLSMLHIGCAVNNGSLDTFLQHGKDINISVKSDSSLWPGCTPLHIAIHNKNIFKIMVLLKYGANINIKNANEISPFQLAIHKKLINNNFMNLILSEYNKTASMPITDIKLFELFSACIIAQSDLIQELLNNGLNVNSVLPFKYPLALPGYTPLHFAVECGDVKTVELLLSKGADLCAQDANGLSPLHLAFHRRNYYIVKNILSFHDSVMKNPIDSTGLSHLHVACIGNETDIITTFLQCGIPVNLPTKTYETPLHFAVKFGSNKVAKLLLEQDADFTAQEINGSTPLHIAIQFKNEDIVTMILALHGEKIINPINETGLSHFHIICMKNKVNLVERFLQNGVAVSASVKPNSINYAGFTPLHFAVKHGCLETVKVLLNHGADITTKDALKKIPLHYAFKLSPSNSRDVLDLFWYTIRTSGTRLIEGTGLTTLHIACMRDDALTVEKLLKQISTVNNCTRLKCPLWPGYNALHFAVKYGSEKTVEALLCSNINVNKTDKYGFTPFHLASFCSKIKIAEKLLDRGCNPAAKSVEGITPLRLAIQANNSMIIQMILSQSVARAINPMDNKGLTYFHIACARRRTSIVEEFLISGANVNEPVHPFAPKFPGYTPLHIAVELRSTPIVDLLLKYGADVNVVDVEGRAPHHLTCLPRATCPYLTSKLLKHGADPDARNNLGYTLVELALKQEHLGILEMALRYGANPSLANPVLNGCHYPLDMAINSLQEQMVDALLNAGADPTAKSIDGSTLIHRTILNVQADESYYVRIFKRLLEHGCDLDALDGGGQAALHRAYWPMNLAGLKALLRCGADVDVEQHSGRSVVSYFGEIRTSRMPRADLYRVFRRHLEVRKCVGFALSRTNEALYETMLEASEEFPGYEGVGQVTEVVCADELQRMGNLRFGYTSLREMLQDVNKMAAHLSRCSALENFLRSSEFDELFPECGCLVMMQYAKALRRRSLLQPALEAIDRLMSKTFSMLPWNAECSEALVEHLSNEDLQNLGGI